LTDQADVLVLEHGFDLGLMRTADRHGGVVGLRGHTQALG
jgi:hypothetical protein